MMRSSSQPVPPVSRESNPAEFSEPIIKVVLMEALGLIDLIVP
jgi:hypothetical protein